MSASEKAVGLWTCIGTGRSCGLGLSGTGFSLCSFDLCELGDNHFNPHNIVA
jgi:hypothetical protein